MKTRKGSGPDLPRRAPLLQAPKSRALLKGRQNVKAPPPVPLTGRQRKDIAMLEAREIATKGGYTGWKHVLETYEARHPDDSCLRIWAGAADRFDVDMICEKWRKAQPNRRGW